MWNGRLLRSGKRESVGASCSHAEALSIGTVRNCISCEYPFANNVATLQNNVIIITYVIKGDFFKQFLMTILQYISMYWYVGTKTIYFIIVILLMKLWNLFIYSLPYYMLSIEEKHAHCAVKRVTADVKMFQEASSMVLLSIRTVKHDSAR